MNLSILEQPASDDDVPEHPFTNGLPNECFFNIVLINISVSNLGMLRTTESISSSSTCTKQQFSSSVGKG